MVEIITKRNGPRKEEAAARRFLRENSATRMKIGNQLSGGRLPEKPVVNPMQGTPAIRRACAAPSRTEDRRPYTSISLNGRVIVIDFNSGRQLDYIGEIRGQGGGRRFLLATTGNLFFSPLAPPLQQLLGCL